ncbi:hypothetical protein CCH79_00017218 [Gambusia affinis]|uniref:Uncharacterized protein n=1 Tax=Gambusia affinis TaxID=33528 RepID=A0A315V6Z1_GAMAF|nr:hypothetical protein CCH79_00017218 [Gambusia affinis]
MSESSGAAVSGAVILEEPEGSGATGGRGEVQAQDQGPFRCAVWPRQQTWLCVVPLLIGFIGLGLSLMLLKWIVVGTVRDYVPTDLVDANRIGQDPIFLSKPSGIPKGPDTTTTTTTPTVDSGNPTSRTVTVAKGRTRTVASTTTINPRGGGASGSQVTPRNPGNRNGRIPSIFTTTTAAPRTTFVIGAATTSSSPANPTVLRDSTQMWTTEHTTTEEASTTLTTHTHSQRKTQAHLKHAEQGGLRTGIQKRWLKVTVLFVSVLPWQPVQGDLASHLLTAGDGEVKSAVPDHFKAEVPNHRDPDQYGNYGVVVWGCTTIRTAPCQGASLSKLEIVILCMQENCCKPLSRRAARREALVVEASETAALEEIEQSRREETPELIWWGVIDGWVLMPFIEMGSGGQITPDDVCRLRLTRLLRKHSSLSRFSCENEEERKQLPEMMKSFQGDEHIRAMSCQRSIRHLSGVTDV